MCEGHRAIQFLQPTKQEPSPQCVSDGPTVCQVLWNSVLKQQEAYGLRDNVAPSKQDKTKDPDFSAFLQGKQSRAKSYGMRGARAGLPSASLH